MDASRCVCFPLSDNCFVKVMWQTWEHSWTMDKARCIPMVNICIHMVNMFMTVKPDAVAFWEQSPVWACRYAPKHGALAWILLMAFPKSLILQKLHMSFLAPRKKNPFPSTFPSPSVSHTHTQSLYPGLLNHLRTPIPQLLPDHSYQPPSLQLLAPKPLSTAFPPHLPHHLSPKPSNPQTSPTLSPSSLKEFCKKSPLIVTSLRFWMSGRSLQK